MDKALAAGATAAQEDVPRAGRRRQVTDANRAWIIRPACQRPWDFGYAEAEWTHRRLPAPMRAPAVAGRHPAAVHVVASTVVKPLHAQVPLHRVPYDLKRRDPDFSPRRVRVLRLYEPVAWPFDPADDRPTGRCPPTRNPGCGLWAERTRTGRHTPESLEKGFAQAR